MICFGRLTLIGFVFVQLAMLIVKWYSGELLGGILEGVKTISGGILMAMGIVMMLFSRKRDDFSHHS